MNGTATRFPVVIKVVGIGHGGIRTANRLPIENFQGVELIAVSDDPAELAACGIVNQVAIERKAAGQGLADTEKKLENALRGGDMIFLIVTQDDDTSIAPTIQKLAQRMGVLVAGILTYPSMFAARPDTTPRHDEKLRLLREGVDTLFIVHDEAPLTEILIALGA